MRTSEEPTEETGRLSKPFSRHEMTIARAETVIVFLALIRALTSYYQIAARPGDTVPARLVAPIVTGSLVAALFCLALTLLSFFGRHRVMHAVFALAITSLVLVKVLLVTG